MKVTILPGVKISSGAVIGACSVVTKNIPASSIAVGNPAQIIRARFSDTTIKKLLEIQWWNWSITSIHNNYSLLYKNPDELSAKEWRQLANISHSKKITL